MFVATEAANCGVLQVLPRKREGVKIFRKTLVKHIKHQEAWKENN